MRTALTALSGVTILVSCWLVTMFFILQHPGFEWRAALATGFGLVSALTIVGIHRAPTPAVRTAVALSNVALAVSGLLAIRANQDEGFVDVVGLTLILQGALAFCWAAFGTKRVRSDSQPALQ